VDLLRRHLASVASFLLIAVVGSGALLVTTHAHDTAEDVHEGDRVALQHTLATLTTQYLLFTAAESFDAASEPGWALEPGDPADVARIEAFLEGAQLVNYGAAVVGLDSVVLTQVAPDPGLPASDHKGYEPLRSALLAGEPGVSDVMVHDGVPLIAVAVPVMVDELPRAVFVSFTRADTSPLQEYASQVTFGETGHGYVLDRNGVVAAGPDPEVVGTTLGGPVGSGGTLPEGFTTYERAGATLVASHSPVDAGGWTSMTEQSESEFFGELRDGRRQSLLSLAGLVALAAAGLTYLAHKRRRALDRVEHQASHDSLTGLPNRSAFRQRVEEALARARRSDDHVAVLFVDLDHFKKVNDALGHDAGDDVLVEVTDRIRSCLREVDFLARMGGDEFTVVLEGLPDVTEAAQVARRITEALAEPIVCHRRQVKVSASVGIALSDGDDPAEAVLRDADLAMYAAKDRGRNCHEVFRDGEDLLRLD